MYSFDLAITIISQDLLLQEFLLSLTAPEGVTLHIVIGNDKWQDTVRTAELIFMDLSSGVFPEEVRALCMADTQVIVYADSTSIDELSEASLQSADAFWMKPLNHKINGIQFKRLVENAWSHQYLYLTTMFLDALMESMPDMVWFKDIAGIHVKVNDSFCRVVGKGKQNITGRDHCYIWDVSREEFAQGKFVCKETDQYVLENRSKCFSTEMVKSQHGMRQFNTYKAPLIYENGELWGTVGIGHDVTDLENMGTELEIILRSMPFAIVVWNDDGIIIDVNDKFEEYFHIKRGTVIGKMYDSWKKDVPYEYLSTGEEGYPEARVFKENQERERIVEIHEEPILDVFHNVVGRLCIYRDITKERELEQRIRDSSNTDFLTGLYNRRYFYQYINENRGEQPINLIYVDLDQFKKVNDTYGHQAGDEALIVTAHLLNECFTDDFVARIGGDEFLVAILGTRTKENLAEKASHLLERMCVTFRNTDSLDTLSASIGIAQSDDSFVDIDLLIRHSDAALYQAKEGGKSRYCFYDSEA